MLVFREESFFQNGFSPIFDIYVYLVRDFSFSTLRNSVLASTGSATVSIMFVAMLLKQEVQRALSTER